MGEKIVHQHGVKGNPEKEIHRRAPNKTLRAVKQAIKKSWADAWRGSGEAGQGESKAGGVKKSPMVFSILVPHRRICLFYLGIHSFSKQ